MRIVVATSIPPITVRYEKGQDVGEAYQQRCIDSWNRAGFRAVSLNFPDEIPSLSQRFPMIEFIPVDKDNSALLGRKTPLLNDVLTVLSVQQESIVGIVNADIFLEEKDWTQPVVAATQTGIAVAHRADVTSLDAGDPAIYDKGYDLFLFRKEHMPQRMPSSFAFGIPWWDYCLQIDFISRGLSVNLLSEPVIFHHQHATNYNPQVWRHMANVFAEFVLQSSILLDSKVSWELLPLIELSQKLLTKSPGRALSFTNKLPFLLTLTGGRIGRNAIEHQLSQACCAGFQKLGAFVPN